MDRQQLAQEDRSALIEHLKETVVAGYDATHPATKKYPLRDFAGLFATAALEIRLAHIGPAAIVDELSRYIYEIRVRFPDQFPEAN